MTSSRKIKKPKSLTLRAMDNIREGITSGAYPLGSPLYEKVLAQEFGISKTPVREALVQLQREGLVVVVPHSGTFVFELADNEVSEICELRLILETNAVQLAMRRQSGRLIADLEVIVEGMRDSLRKKQHPLYRKLDAQFHQALFKHSDNQYLRRCYTMIEAKLETLRVSLITPLPNVVKISLDEHVQIVKALRESQVEAATEVLTHHIKRARELMRGLKEAAPVNVGKMKDF